MVVLFVLITLIAALTIEQIIASQKKSAKAVTVSGIPIFNRSSIYAPKGYLISKYHTWVHPEEKTVKIGIDNFAVKTLGNIIIKHIANPGSTVKKGDTVITADVHGREINFRSPVSGTVKAINTYLFKNKIKDAYGNDWGLIIENGTQKSDLMFGKQAQNWLKNEIRRLKDFLAESSLTPEAVGVTMYDGGNIAEGVVSHLSPKVIPDFERQFLCGTDE
jgi:glycine cleavage system H lipoate-binding protein